MKLSKEAGIGTMHIKKLFPVWIATFVLKSLSLASADQCLTISGPSYVMVNTSASYSATGSVDGGYQFATDSSAMTIDPDSGEVDAGGTPSTDVGMENITVTDSDGNSGYTNITVYDIKNVTTVSAPDGTADNRTTIGLGEQVKLNILPSTITNVSWELTWASEGSLSVPNANATVLIAALDSGEDTVQFTFDSGDAGNLVFDVVAPTGLQILPSYLSEPPGTPGPPNNNIGAITTFHNAVIPDSVSFSNLSMRENIAAGSNTWTWIDGTPGNGPSGQFPFTVNQYDNSYPDNNAIAGDPIGRLQDSHNIFHDKNITLVTPLEYLNGANTWTSFDPDEDHNVYFSGADQSAMWEEEDTNTVDADSQGPFQNIAYGPEGDLPTDYPHP